MKPKKDPKAYDYAHDTWLEPEEYCYPNGAMRRRAYVIDNDTDKYKTVHCGIPDTYFSIPCKGNSYLAINTNTDSEYYGALMYYSGENKKEVIIKTTTDTTIYGKERNK